MCVRCSLTYYPCSPHWMRPKHNQIGSGETGAIMETLPSCTKWVRSKVPKKDFNEKMGGIDSKFTGPFVVTKSLVKGL